VLSTGRISSAWQAWIELDDAPEDAFVLLGAGGSLTYATRYRVERHAGIWKLSGETDLPLI